MTYKQYKVLSSLSPTRLWTDLIKSNTSSCLINQYKLLSSLSPTRLCTDLNTSNTSRCPINSINYYQVYHRQNFERTWLRVTPRGVLKETRTAYPFRAHVFTSVILVGTVTHLVRCCVLFSLSCLSSFCVLHPMWMERLFITDPSVFSNLYLQTNHESKS